MEAPQKTDVVQFAARILAILDEAHATTTYKYALLVALIDECQANVGAAKGPRGSITTRQIAERVTANYWGQIRVHPTVCGPLQQMTRRRDRSIPDLIIEFKQRYGERKTSTAFRAQQTCPDDYETLIDDVEWILIRYPIPLLQQIGNQPTDVLYRVTWQAGSPGGVPAYQRGYRDGKTKHGTSGFDNRLALMPGVEENLSILAGLLRPVIRRQWARFVARTNKGIEDVEEFLFEPNRAHLRKLQGPLSELQDNRCFYCGDRVTRPEVDHFLPWSRCGDDSLANLVIADRRCNGSKSDHIAAVVHLQTWADRLKKHGHDLQAIAANEVWANDPTRSRDLTRSVYSSIPAKVPLWVSRNDFRDADPNEIGSTLLAMTTEL